MLVPLDEPPPFDGKNRKPEVISRTVPVKQPYLWCPANASAAYPALTLGTCHVSFYLDFFIYKYFQRFLALPSGHVGHGEKHTVSPQ